MTRVLHRAAPVAPAPPAAPAGASLPPSPLQRPPGAEHPSENKNPKVRKIPKKITAFNLFLSEQIQNYPSDKPFKEIFSRFRQQWTELSEKDKLPWLISAEEKQKEALFDELLAISPAKSLLTKKEKDILDRANGKPPNSVYGYFVRKILRSGELSHYPIKDRMKEVAPKWKAVEPKQRQKLESLLREEQRQYVMQLADFLSRHPEESVDPLHLKPKEEFFSEDNKSEHSLSAETAEHNKRKKGKENKSPEQRTKYKVNASLYLHVQRHHPAPNSASILCTDCGKTFLTKTLFKIHMLVHHDTTGKNKVQCKHCDVVCKNQLSMKAHEKLHSGVRVSCHLCSYTTHQKKFLTNHMRVKHTDAKPFSCSICHKSFKRKSCLRAHLAQHTGEAKYSCTFCPRTFVSSGNCSSHRKRMHPEECKNEKRRILNEKLKGIEIPPDPEEVESEDIHQLAREIVSKMNKLSRKKLV